MPLTGQTISSSKNPLLQQIRRAVASGRPLENGCFAAEGPHALAEALASSWTVEQVFCSMSVAGQHHHLLSASAARDIEIIEVAQRAFETIRDTQHTQGILALLRPRLYSFRDVLSAPGPLVILDGIQDPGNAGSIVRSAEAFAASGVVFTRGCVRASNGKLMRAAAGSLFRIPFVENIDCAEAVQQVQCAKRALFALAADGTLSLATTNLRSPFALVVGSEGHGVSAGFLAAAQTLSISTRQVESLNAAIACSLALYEAARQREFQP